MVTIWKKKISLDETDISKIVACIENIQGDMNKIVDWINEREYSLDDYVDRKIDGPNLPKKPIEKSADKKCENCRFLIPKHKDCHKIFSEIRECLTNNYKYFKSK